MEDVYWECFFNNAGISGKASKDYASLFVKNKISQPILMHINDNHLKSMGIEAIGDVIRILKYIKDFPQTEQVSKTISENTERHVEVHPIREPSKQDYTQKISMSTKYEKIPGCELPVATRRVVNPEIEGRYKITLPNKLTSLKNNQLTTQSSSMKCSSATNLVQYKDINKPIDIPNRTVILSDTSKSEVKQNPSILKRLGESLEKYEKLTNPANHYNSIDTEIPTKKPKVQIVNNKTILKRFFHASLSKDSHTKISLSEKLPSKNIIQTNKGNVFLRLGNQDDEDDNVDFEESVNENPPSLPYIGVFKLPNETKIKGDEIKVRSGHTTESIRKVEATSTTSNFQSIRIEANSNKMQSIKDRLGRR